MIKKSKRNTIKRYYHIFSKMVQGKFEQIQKWIQDNLNLFEQHHVRWLVYASHRHHHQLVRIIIRWRKRIYGNNDHQFQTLCRKLMNKVGIKFGNSMRNPDNWRRTVMFDDTVRV